MSIAFLVAGLVLLVLAGDALVRGAVSAARRMHVPPLVIGLTIVAFGTSAPELIVSVDAALAGAPGLAMGNVVGSNIANILIVLGLPAIITPIVLSESGIRRSSAFMIVVTMMAILIAIDGYVSRFDGLFMFGLLCLYLTYSGVAARRERNSPAAADAAADVPEAENLSMLKILFLLVFGVAGLGLGGKLTTEGAIGVAEILGMPDSAIGLTIVALGTSLPELATSIAAALRRQTGVVIGNVIGSNIFNILGIVGVTAMLVPLEVSDAIVGFDMWVMLLVTSAMVPIAFTTRRINRTEGVLMSLGYIVYAVVVLHSGMTP